MFMNYFKVSIRNLLKYKTFSFINIFGLSIAMTISMLVIMMLADQHSYDKFNLKRDRIFRILSERPAVSSVPFASTPPNLLLPLRDEYYIVEKATHLITGVGGEATSELTTVEMRGFFTDENFLQIFDFDLASGSMNDALRDPYSLVITAEMSRILFGNENALGKTVDFVDRGLHYLKSGKDSAPVPWGRFTITGVIADRNYKSHLKFDVLMSASSQAALGPQNKFHVQDEGWDKAYTYVLLRDRKDQAELDLALADLFDRKYARSSDAQLPAFRAQPLMKISPGIMVNQPTRFELPIEGYYFLGSIALAILLSACLNYTNLSTARALTRAKEIGVRKVTGATRRDLVFQFLSESVVTSLCALAFAVIMLFFIRPAFMGLWLNRFLNFDLNADLSVYIIFTCFALLLGIIAGLYPAIRLSAFQPAKAIKSPDNVPGRRLGVRKALSASQFIISLFFVITSILIYNQFRYFMSFKYGFEASNIVNVELQGNEFRRISDALGSVAGVTTISASEYIPAAGRTSGMDIKGPNSDEAINFRILAADDHFAENLRLKFIAGRNLPAITDSISRFVVVNETAVKALGFKSPAEIIGVVLIQAWNEDPLEVVGVVEDFWLKLPIGGDRLEPAVLRNHPKRFSYANIKINTTDVPSTLMALEGQWKNVDPVHPFKYRFYEDELEATHAGIFDVVSVVGYLAFIAITIACLGMLGMAMYTAERKRKEVGIRKLLGAETMALALMLSKEFLLVMAIAICIGAPLSWFVNNLWLQSFANRAEFGLGTMLTGTLLLVALGLLTIGSQTIRVSKSNPVDTLKTE